MDSNREKTHLLERMHMLKRTPYQPPAAPFKPGDRVKLEDWPYTVVASTHTHTQLEGLPYAVANWRLRKVTLKKKRIKAMQTSPAGVKTTSSKD